MLKVVESAADCQALIDWARDKPMLAIDTETTGLDVRAPDFRVRLVQIGTRDEAWVVPFDRWAGAVHELVDRYRGTWAMWNAKYDVAALATHGLHVPWGQVDDCMVACRIAEPTESAALKKAAVRHVAPGSAMAQRDLSEGMKKNSWTWATVPLMFEPYVRYAAMDVILTSRLWEHPVIQSGLTSPVYNLEMETLVICHNMAETGLRIDVDYCTGEAKRLRELTDSLAETTREEFGVKISSATELVRFFLERSAPITKRTASGAPSVDKEQLELLITWDGHREVTELARRVLRYRKADKIAGSYLESFIELADADGIIHADIETLAAKTGRMSIRRPGLQTLPKPGEAPESRMVRKAVIPRQDGEVLVSADFAQIEMRVIGALSEDPKLIGAFAEADETGGDFFAEMGKVVYRDPGFTKADKRRKTIKGVMYGLAYGAGPDKLALTAGITVEEAREVRSSLLAAFPGLSRAMTTYERQARADGRVRTLLGRELVVPEEQAYKGLNAVIQGSAADLFKRSLVRMAHAGVDEFMVVPVHDEIVVSVPEDIAIDVRDAIVDNMLIDDLAVKVPAEASPPLERWADDA